ncbi:MAG: hypothetical protein AAGB04_00370 [Pseudomonadota bacterium]
MRNLLTTLLILVTLPARAEIVGVNEAANVPQHPEYRLKNITQRARGWKNDQLGLTAASTITLPDDSEVALPPIAAPLVTPDSAKYRFNDKAGVILRDPSEPSDATLVDAEAEHVGPFRQAFIDDLSRFGVWRTMDLSKTNGNTQAEWGDRPTLDGPAGQWFELGWPWELQIEAANLAEVDLWICVPHMATDDYVTQLGKLFAENLDSDRTVYVEFTNEAPWNTGPAFIQSPWIIANLAGGNKPDANRAYGKRAAEVWQLFADSAGDVRLKRVLSGQAGAVRVIREALEGVEDVGGKPDVISCAAYFNPDKDVNQPKVRVLYDHYDEFGEDADKAFELMRQSIRDRSEWWRNHAAVADSLGLPLIAYEGGQHIAAAGQHRSNTEYVAWLQSLQRDPRIQDIYKVLRETWRDAGGDGLLYFQRLAGPAPPFGSWGHRDFAGDDSPKNQAVDEHIAESSDVVEPEPTPDDKVIFKLVDGGLGNATDWIGRKASRYTKETAKTIELVEPIRPPFTIAAQVARVGIRDGFHTNGDKWFGMASVVRLWSTEHGGFMTLDHCEPTKPAGRSRAVEYRWNADGSLKRRADGKLDIVGLQNGSSPANDRVDIVHLLTNNERGRWHHIYGVYNPDDFRPYESDVDNLWCWIDDNDRSIQGKDTDPVMNREFNRITIGAGDPGSNCKLYVREVLVTQEVGTVEKSQARARSLGLTFDGGDWYDESTWPADKRYVTLDSPKPEEPDVPEPTVLGEWMLRLIEEDGEHQLKIEER